MLRSMTGFGRCLIEDERVSQQWEIRSVNSRYLDIKWRLPALARYLESSFEKIARRKALRGRLEISLALRFGPDQAPRPAFNRQLAMSMLNELADLAKIRGEEFHPDHCRLLSLPELWAEPELEEIEDLASSLQAGLTAALDDWNESREAEAEALAADLENRILQMSEWHKIISNHAPESREERLRQLRNRLAALLAECGADLAEDRFLQEMVILADKLDVSEELTRLDSHLGRMRQLLREGKDAGRRLDFTLQECFREINTCGNKIQDAELSQIVVNFKNELEKCREQAQNLE